MLEFGAEKVLLWGHARRTGRGAHAPQNSELLEGFQQSIFIGQLREGSRRVCDQFSDWLVSQRLTLSIFRHQKAPGLRAHDHQVVNFFHLVVVFSI